MKYTKQEMIKNYGYHPFSYFQQLVILIQILIINYSVQIKKYLNDFCIKYLGNEEYYTYIYKLILTIPLFLIIYYDTRYSSFALKNIGVPIEYNRYVNQVLFILGSYGIIQVLGQDTGLQTGVDQRDLVQYPIIFAILCVGMAFSITENRSQSIIAMFLYFHLRYVISDRLSNVCFEDLGEPVTDEQADAQVKTPTTV
jgi:hypothetical protein